MDWGAPSQKLQRTAESWARIQISQRTKILHRLNIPKETWKNWIIADDNGYKPVHLFCHRVFAQKKNLKNRTRHCQTNLIRKFQILHWDGFSAILEMLVNLSKQVQMIHLFHWLIFKFERFGSFQMNGSLCTRNSWNKKFRRLFQGLNKKFEPRNVGLRLAILF